MGPTRSQWPHPLNILHIIYSRLVEVCECEGKARSLSSSNTCSELQTLGRDAKLGSLDVRLNGSRVNTVENKEQVEEIAAALVCCLCCLKLLFEYSYYNILLTGILQNWPIASQTSSTKFFYS